MLSHCENCVANSKHRMVLPYNESNYNPARPAVFMRNFKSNRRCVGNLPNGMHIICEYSGGGMRHMQPRTGEVGSYNF